MAGESARATAGTRRADAEQLRTAADPTPRPAAVQESTARTLGALSAQGWRVFHDVTWPGRSQARIDHVLVGPSGVFVIDSESWTGSIEVRGGQLRQDGRRGARHVIAAAAAAMAVGELLPALDPKAIHPVICIARDEPIFGWSGDTMVCSTENVVTFLTSRPKILDESQLTEVSEILALSLKAAAAKVPPPVAKYAGGDAPAVTEPVEHDSDKRKERLPRAPLPQAVKVLIAVGVLAAITAVGFQLDLPARLGHLGADAASRVLTPTEPIGTTVSVPSLGSRPSLEVTAGAPVVTRSKLRGIRPGAGHQLVAVPVAVHNVDETSWANHSDVRAMLTDSGGTTYSADPAYTSVSAGAALPTSMTLHPGKTRRGLIVFEVPRGVEVAKVRLRVGPGLPTTLRWSVG
jgi:hypothetical protein